MTLLGIKREQGPIRRIVRAWWRDAWQSPMAPRWLKTDMQVLLIAARLHQQLAVNLEEGKAIASIASEIRQQESRLGLDVMARRRLDWRIEGPRAEAPMPAPETAPAEPEGFDPRSVLRAV